MREAGIQGAPAFCFLIVFTKPQVQRHGKKGRPSSRWVFFSQTTTRRVGSPSAPLPLVHAHFNTSRLGNPPVHCDFDAARWGNPSTVLVHLDFDARRWGTHSTTPFTSVSMPEGGEPLRAFRSPMF